VCRSNHERRSRHEDYYRRDRFGKEHIQYAWHRRTRQAGDEAHGHGTRAVLATLNGKTDRASAWVRSLIERCGYKRAAVALAAKNARTIWAMLAKGQAYCPSAPV
jgi:hypothetical protein